MPAILDWVKRNFLTLLLVVVILFLLLKNQISPMSYSSRSLSLPSAGIAGNMASEKSFASLDSAGISLPYNQAAPTPEVTDRLVVQNSNLSLQVTEVIQTQGKIKSQAETLGGYMVESNSSRPEESVTGDITVRVPSASLDQFLVFCRGLAVKVVSENLQGYDVTDQFVDTQARIDTLEKTKAKFNDILDKANQVQDILTVQREIINIQSQIDNLKGQNKYLEATAKNTKVTIYMASDEMSLPYAPSNAWRPAVIFKTAVRSMVSTIRGLGTLLIWVGVFSVIWVPVLIVILVIRRRRKSV